MSVKWESPPLTTRVSGMDLREEAEVLKSHPKRWGLIYPFDPKDPLKSRSRISNIASRINRGLMAGFERGDWQAKSRTPYGVYVRYIGARRP